MRALRILLIVVVILGGLFVLVDRVAVHFAEGEAADKLKATQNLADTPDVSIEGFPFLTQVASGSLDDVHVGIKDYEAATGQSGRTIRIDDLQADMKGVDFSGDYSSATASTATGSALISYAELMKAAQFKTTDIIPGVTALVTGLSDGGNGKIKVAVNLKTPLGTQTVSVLSSVTVDDDRIQVHADSLPKAVVDFAESKVRSVTDFRQTVGQLPGGIKLDTVRAAKDGVRITVRGSHVELAG
ncbi:DUF2993 domain-containing protein [Streptomyces mangrovisoli]|uniref:DUF2993 domain-containing protein n=1 Tax=Streptomyces mangrovisoli TaxID=1428628 RepID=A0A1J4NUB1_9ACTN|nr:DUF2993 domain-containing protein [Streptomyces mangrovisoli]OIJ64837.1 hypothetical protein WN71_026825 [Streptomyces mangrovisoli]